ncbi:hypothetical protein BBJ29_000833 [Phytophthora kernoviae]|uniref:Uncharacterized protein n=1 Tax=Phytophthora kernoviae TaxID=325452 RepID=A0A3F2S474_9STRA|nr:hypothetical protein BBJ29_000833 [Phytophthora kernoviae]RLN69149.1 hypothetical protein BBP00_00000549 [Phytophthora kernoviae]
MNSIVYKDKPPIERDPQVGIRLANYRILLDAMTLQRPALSIADRRRERDMQHELLKFHHDRTDPIATALTKKRVRVPHVELEANPFCLERQMADNYQQLNFNKVRSCWPHVS